MAGPQTLQKPLHADRWEANLLGNYGTPRLLLARGEGPYVYTSEAVRYLDLLGGLAVNAVGHCHPRVVEAVRHQAGLLAHVSNLYATEPVIRLAERLSHMTDGRKAVFANSGAEANEAAFKLIRRHAHATGRPDGVVVAFDGSFHGRTMATVTLTGQPAHQDGFDPLVPNIVHVPFNDVAALETVFETHPVVGVFAEFVQGEGGVVPMHPPFAKALGRLTEQHDALLVADEIQTGMGRTGRLFAFEHFGLEPDVITLAKALGGGYPIGVSLVRPKLAEHLPAGSHGTTFGGNPVSCAAAHAVLDIFEDEGLVARSESLGMGLTAALAEGLEGTGVTPRGLGMIIGLPLPQAVAPKIVQALEGERILIGQAGKSVARLAPPLNIEEEVLFDAVPKVTAAVRAHLDG